VANMRALVFKAIRDRLVADSTLIGYVPVAKIRTGEGNLPAVYPCIMLGIISKENGLADTLEGRISIRIYTRNQAYAETLDTIHSRIFDLLHKKETSISNDDIAIDLLWEISASSWINEPEAPKDTWSLTAFYVFAAQAK